MCSEVRLLKLAAHFVTSTSMPVPSAIRFAKPLPLTCVNSRVMAFARVVIVVGADDVQPVSIAVANFCTVLLCVLNCTLKPPSTV